MCIVIDANTIASVLNPASDDYDSFSPVLDWILRGKGKLVYAGKTYQNEIPEKYLSIFTELSKIGRVARGIDGNKVDAYEAKLKKKPLGKLNDHHLIAIIAVSGCKLLCTKNISKKAGDIEHFKDSALYPDGIKPPAIYSGLRNKKLLSDSKIADCCKPCVRTTKSTASKMDILLGNKKK